MDTKGLLFIPDISGFTRFVNSMEIDHSRQIIQELLEVLVRSNSSDLEISEIEGDAILFYKYGDPPDLAALYAQVERMFVAFHQSLSAYDHRRFCQCTACTSAINLSLKIITHYGEFTNYQVQQFKKLIGKDIIIAHQLLKNDINQHEYWLVSHGLINQTPVIMKEWMKWDTSKKITEAGEVPFYYTMLSELKKEVPPEIVNPLDVSKKTKVISVTQIFETEIIPLFHATGDFTYRSQWLEGVREVEALNHYLPRVGMKCKCVFDDGQAVIYSSSYYFTPEHIEFSENDETHDTATFYTLQKIDDSHTRLTIDFFISKNVFNQLAFQLGGAKKKKENMFNASLHNLELFVKKISQKLLETNN